VNSPVNRLERDKARILDALQKAGEPLTTKELVEKTELPRHILRYRLLRLLSEGKVKGKQTNGRGAWIWWLTR
jgi:DNA-binding GntR family transcriptional regulator